MNRLWFFCWKVFLNGYFCNVDVFIIDIINWVFKKILIGYEFFFGWNLLGFYKGLILCDYVFGEIFFFGLVWIGWIIFSFIWFYCYCFFNDCFVMVVNN